MKNLIFLFSLSLMFSCSTTLPPKEQRKLEFIENTTASKSKAYTNALAFIAKSFGDSREVLKAKDKDAGLIVLKGNTKCNIFRQAGDINDYLLQFTLTINLKNNKAKLLYENLFISSETGNPIGWDYNQLSNPKKVQKSKECLTNINKGLIKAINLDW